MMRLLEPPSGLLLVTLIASVCQRTSPLRMAHDFDSLGVDGLDLAIYRNSRCRFELISGDPYWEEATKLSDGFGISICQMLREQAIRRRIG